MDEQMNEAMGQVDPVSGNEVPTGAMPEEVRDDVDAKLSEGEYVVPADVVRFYGVNFFEKLRTQAKEGWAEMEATGRVGGEPVAPEGATPNAPDELAPEDLEQLKSMVAGGGEPMGMAEGGLVGSAVGMDVAGDTEMMLDTFMDTVRTNPELQSSLRKRGMQFNTGGLVTEQDIMDGLQSMPMFKQGFAEGGAVQGTFDPSKYGFGFSLFGTPDMGMPTSNVELVEYANADGYKIMIRTIDGVPIDEVPEGYAPVDSMPTQDDEAPKPQTDVDYSRDTNPTGSTANAQRQQESNKDYFGMTPDELAEEIDRSAMWGKSASMLGGTLGPAGVVVSGVAQAAGKGRMAALGNVAQTLAEEALAAGNTDLANQYAGIADSVSGVRGIGVDWASNNYYDRWSQNRSTIDTQIQDAFGNTDDIFNNATNKTTSTNRGVTYETAVSEPDDNERITEVSRATGSTAPTSSPVPTARPESRDDSSSESKGFYESLTGKKFKDTNLGQTLGFEKGGYVKRPKK